MLIHVLLQVFRFKETLITATTKEQKVSNHYVGRYMNKSLIGGFTESSHVYVSRDKALTEYNGMSGRQVWVDVS